MCDTSLTPALPWLVLSLLWRDLRASPGFFFPTHPNKGQAEVLPPRDREAGGHGCLQELPADGQRAGVVMAPETQHPLYRTMRFLTACAALSVLSVQRTHSPGIDLLLLHLPIQKGFPSSRCTNGSLQAAAKMPEVILTTIGALHISASRLGFQRHQSP